MKKQNARQLKFGIHLLFAAICWQMFFVLVLTVSAQAGQSKPHALSAAATRAWLKFSNTAKELLKYDRVGAFSDGLAYVQAGDKAGFIDKTGRELTGLKYERIDAFSEESAAARLNRKWGFIDKRGSEVVPFKYDYFVAPFSANLAKASLRGKWGFIDKKGRTVVSLKYDGVWCNAFIKEGFIGVKLDGKKGFVDLHGNEYFNF